MKKLFSCLLCLTLTLGLISFVAPQPVFADDCDTSILNVSCDDRGGGIWGILDVVLIILTASIGVLAVLGFVIAGIMYATASGSEERVKKAKTMIFNIVLGLVIYALLWALLEFLIPGGRFNLDQL